MQTLSFDVSAMTCGGSRVISTINEAGFSAAPRPAAVLP